MGGEIRGCRTPWNKVERHRLCPHFASCGSSGHVLHLFGFNFSHLTNKGSSLDCGKSRRQGNDVLDSACRK